ncbi:hypothetical protein EX895_004802 [Sporisorium graminicola]|uniref:Zn(2)-C6 fungal-type domain-containing protein n=1 Tax=Sporisorium graminicola TaxID=280036 RepID=A0A4U7KQ22_9BASI|nr:hypothetical protein EX895_004802 [Sporisorium graminicola]TKY85977.1 hypothetical protein EX895_004802 [Sporisorium graminicola]
MGKIPVQPWWVEAAVRQGQAVDHANDDVHHSAHEHSYIHGYEQTHFSSPVLNGTSTSYIQPYSRAVSRSRVAMACTHCRHRKARCDGIKPSCSLCVHLERPCKYVKVSVEENARLREKKRATKLRRSVECAKFHENDLFNVYPPYRHPDANAPTATATATVPKITSTMPSHRSASMEQEEDRMSMLAASAPPLPQVGVCAAPDASVMQTYVYGGGDNGIVGDQADKCFDIGGLGGSRRASPNSAIGPPRGVSGAGYTYPRKPSMEDATRPFESRFRYDIVEAMPSSDAWTGFTDINAGSSTLTMPTHTVDSTTAAFPLQPALRPTTVTATDAYQHRYTATSANTAFDAPSSSSSGSWWESPVVESSPIHSSYPRLNRNKNRSTVPDLRSPLMSATSFTSSPSCSLTSPAVFETSLPALDHAFSSDSNKSTPDQHLHDDEAAVFWFPQVAAGRTVYRGHEGAERSRNDWSAAAVAPASTSAKWPDFAAYYTSAPPGF